MTQSTAVKLYQAPFSKSRDLNEKFMYWDCNFQIVLFCSHISISFFCIVVIDLHHNEIKIIIMQSIMLTSSTTTLYINANEMEK